MDERVKNDSVREDDMIEDGLEEQSHVFRLSTHYQRMQKQRGKEKPLSTPPPPDLSHGASPWPRCIRVSSSPSPLWPFQSPSTSLTLSTFRYSSSASASLNYYFCSFQPHQWQWNLKGIECIDVICFRFKEIQLTLNNVNPTHSWRQPHQLFQRRECEFFFTSISNRRIIPLQITTCNTSPTTHHHNLFSQTHEYYLSLMTDFVSLHIICNSLKKHLSLSPF